jgi:hypothetical protein
MEASRVDGVGTVEDMVGRMLGAKESATLFSR